MKIGYYEGTEMERAAMFAILPQTNNFIWDDADYFTDEQSAYDSAWDWSAELHGVPVNVYKEQDFGYNVIAQVFS